VFYIGDEDISYFERRITVLGCETCFLGDMIKRDNPEVKCIRMSDMKIADNIIDIIKTKHKPEPIIIEWDIPTDKFRDLSPSLYSVGQNVYIIVPLTRRGDVSHNMVMVSDMVLKIYSDKLGYEVITVKNRHGAVGSKKINHGIGSKLDVLGL